MDNPCGSKLKQRREELGWSIRKAASESGISEGRLRQVELGYEAVGNGIRKPVRPSSRILRTLARAYGELDPDELVALAEGTGRNTEPDVKDAAHMAFVDLIRADPTLDEPSKHHIINQHALLQRVVPDNADTLDQLAKKRIAGVKAVKKAARKRQTPEAR